jgi:hypothetical protein
MKKPPASMPRELDDDAIVREGEAALQERLGTMGMLRLVRSSSRRRMGVPISSLPA